MFTPDWYESAHQQLRLKYPRNLCVAFVLSLAVLGLGTAYAPPYVPAPYQLRERRVTAVDVQTEVRVPDAPRAMEVPPDTPIREVEPADDAGAIETIGITDFNPFAPPDLPPTGPAQPESFVAYDSPPVLVHAEEPEYPDLARAVGAEGTVTVLVTIDATGRVIEATVSSSNAVPALEAAALAAARRFLFEPAKQRDVPVSCQLEIPFAFSEQRGAATRSGRNP